MMKYKIIFILLIFVPISFAFSDTIMLYTGKPADSNVDLSEIIPYISFIEDGIMDILFDSGHIIFNLDINTEDVLAKEKLNFIPESMQLRYAKSNGADFLLEILLETADISPANGNIEFSGVWKFSDVLSGTIIVNGCKNDS